MTKEQRKSIKEKIFEEISAIEHEIRELQESVKPVAPDCSLGRLTRQEMMLEQQVAEHTLREAEIKLNRLTYAKRDVEREGYGICAECEEEIAYERLLILPESTRCVACMNELGL